MEKDLLSIIVPAYKQEKTIVQDLLSMKSQLEKSQINYEIICVVDGFVDRTYENAKTIESANIKIIGYEKNQGKGYAVRYGMSRAKGNLIGFIDAGMDINPRCLPLLLEHMRWYDSDIIVGSIRHSASKVIGYPLKRKIYSIGYHWLTRLLFGLKITDTQRGVKIFKREVLEQVLPKMVVSGFSFDIEILAVAHRLGFQKIHDGPVEMDARKFKYSSVRSSTVFKMLIETLGVYYRINFLKYYDNQKFSSKEHSSFWQAKELKEKEKKFVSVIIPVRTKTAYLTETISCLQKQTIKDFEIIVVTDEKEKIPKARVFASKIPTPAYKRNLGASKAKGEIFAFLDDDSYPERNWLENALKIFARQKINDRPIVGVCGPALTPKNDNLYQKVSGWVWSSFFGSAGAGLYRSRPMPEREVDDFPSVNFLVKKEDFLAIGGFDVNHWPGEDTKLCLDLVKNRGTILYNPEVIVYHHRRPIFLPHLQQISRYAKRRGYFAKKFPETSRRLGYFFPSIFAYGLILGTIASFCFPFVIKLMLLFLSFYFVWLILAGLEVLLNKENLYFAILVMISIYLTHFVYGFLFPFGFFSSEIATKPRLIDARAHRYLGG